MVVDVSGFSRMMGSDEEGTVAVIQDFHRRLDALVEQFEGRVVGTSGDSALGEFDSVVHAVRCARRIQETLTAGTESRFPDQFRARIGIHLGDVIVEEATVYGDGVNIAARLEPLAEPGGICLSEAVFHQIRNKIDLPFEDMGIINLKNIEHPIRLYKIPPAKPVQRELSLGLLPHAAPDLEATVQSWFNDIIRAKHLVPLLAALLLLLSPAVLFPTGGVFPTGGAVLLGVIVGQVWAQRARQPGNFQISLGAGIACGALLTNWSTFTNILFLMGGLIVSATGVTRNRKPAP